MSEWRTSSHSGSQGECVEVKMISDSIFVRDTKHRDGGVHRFTVAGWAAFVERVKAGEFDPR